MYDPDFDFGVMEDSAQDAYFVWAGVSVATENENGDSTVGGVLFEQDAGVDCTIHGFGLSDPPRTVTFNMPLNGGRDTTASVRDAMDTILAAHPEVAYFTIEPQVQIGAFDAINACGDPADGFLYEYDRDHPPPAWTRVQGEFGYGGEQPQTYQIDGTPVDIAVLSIGPAAAPSWFVDGSWGPASATDGMTTFDDGGLGAGSRWGRLGTTSARDTFLLRASALTWSGQDPSNTANRVFWQTGDVVGDESHRITGQWGHVQGAMSIQVRGWVLVESRRWMCFL